MSSAPRDVAIDAVQHAMRNEGPAIAGLQALRAPVVAINAGYEPTDAPSMLRYGVRVVVMPGVGHMLMLDDPERFNGILDEVVAGFA